MPEPVIDYAIAMTEEGYALVQWHDSNNVFVSEELDIESADVKEALALIRKIVWGAPND